MNLEIFKKLGLTKNQAKVYVSLLKLGEGTAQEIMKESELHRSRVYDSLESLQREGLVSSVIKNFKSYFQAAKPEKLIDSLEEKKKAIKEIIPELKKIEGMKKESINAFVYKGNEGLKVIHTEMLKEGKDIYVLGAKGLIFSEFPYFIPNFGREMKNKKIKMFCLWDNEEAKNNSSKQKFIEGKILPKGYESNGVINIFGNKIATVLWKEKYPTAFMIENKDIAEAHKKWFDLIWKIAKNNSSNYPTVTKRLNKSINIR